MINLILFLTINYQSLASNFSTPMAKQIGDVNGDGINETVEVASVFNQENAETDYYYHFNDQKISMLPTTGCASIETIYDIEDIDQDGADEIAVYSSSCVSRYKSIRVYTLKNNRWIEEGRAIIDANRLEPSVPERIVKTGKGTFQIREITVYHEGKLTDKWLPFKMGD